jgi:hypothetical protein
MTTPFQAQANRANARHSTGPRTDAGKTRSTRNGLKHGLCAETALLPGESAADWREHREGVLISLGVKGALETALADRVALALWRLRRVGPCDAATAARELPADGRPSPDDDLLDKIMRYETHLSRQALRALQTLERLQLIRDRQPALASFAVDDTLDLFDRLHQARLDARRRLEAAPEDKP